MLATLPPKCKDSPSTRSTYDEPVAKRAALHLAATMIEDILCTGVDIAAVALLRAVSVDGIRFAAAGMFWRLLLVVICPGTISHRMPNAQE